MNPQIASLQKTSDHFALLGLPRAYAVTSEKVQDAASVVRAQLDAAAPNADASTLSAIADLRQRLEAATTALLNPLLRGEYLLSVFGSATDANAVPPEFHDTWNDLQQLVTSAVAAGDDERLVSVHEQLLAARQLHLDRVAQVFSFPRGVPNAVSQAARDLTIGSELNAVRMVDELLREV